MPMLELTVGLSGPEYTLEPGAQKEFSDYEAGRLIAAGFGVPVEDGTKAPAPTPRRKKKPHVVSS